MHFAFYEFSMLVTQRDFIQAERNCGTLHANVQIIKGSAEMEAEFMKAEERERQIRDDGVKNMI